MDDITVADSTKGLPNLLNKLSMLILEKKKVKDWKGIASKLYKLFENYSKSRIYFFGSKTPKTISEEKYYVFRGVLRPFRTNDILLVKACSEKSLCQCDLYCNSFLEHTSYFGSLKSWSLGKVKNPSKNTK